MMKKFELPVMNIKVFESESIVTDSKPTANQTDVAMQNWQQTNDGFVKKIDTAKDLVKFTY